MKQISKSDFMLYVKHPAWLWLKKNDPDKIPAANEQAQAAFKNGLVFERYAEQRFPEATRLGFDNLDEYASLIGRTEQTIKDGAKVIFQGRFQKDGFSCVSDVIEIVEEGMFDLYEIKSSTSVKPEHIIDLAFQTMVIESLGYSVNKISIIRLDGEYVKNGEIVAEELSVVEDVTESVREQVPFVISEAPNALKITNSKTMPDPSPSLAKGGMGDYLAVYRNLREIPEYSIFDLVRVGTTLVGKFESLGVEKIADIPDDFIGLTVKQQAQVEATKTGEPIIQNEEIAEFLDSLEYPLYFLDYETYSSVVPLFDGQRPYQQVPFQYSLHVIRERGSEVEHFEYLHDGNSDPIVPLTESLGSQIGKTGMILTWNKGFESSCNTKMGESHPEYRGFYEKVNNRIDDLDIPFARLWYVDYRFKGSYSIKKVLPVLAPELSYKDLEINNGGQAQDVWMKAYFDNDPAIDKDWLRENMLKYCGLDTYAMVVIHEKLQDLISGGKSAVPTGKEINYNNIKEIK